MYCFFLVKLCTENSEQVSIPQDRLQIHTILLIFVVHFPARDFFRYYYIRVKALHEYPENNLRIPLT